MRERGEDENTGGIGTLVSGVLGGLIWLFLASDPSTLALLIAGLLLCYLFLGYLALALLLPDPNEEPAPSSERFAPLRTEYNRPKALTL